MCFNYFLAGPNLEPSEEAYVSLLEFLEGAVSVGTRTGYAADWAAWCSFIGSEKGLGVGGDPYLKGLKGDRIRTVCVCLHIKSLYESGKRDKQAHKCTAAIKHYFTVAGLSVEFLGTMHAPNHMIRTARGATKSSADELRIAGQRRVATVKLPVFRELMDLLQEQLWEGKGWGWKDIDGGVMTYVCG